MCSVIKMTTFTTLHVERSGRGLRNFSRSLKSAHQELTRGTTRTSNRGVVLGRFKLLHYSKQLKVNVGNVLSYYLYPQSEMFNKAFEREKYALRASQLPRWLPALLI